MLLFRFLLLFSMITSADTEDIVVATELESQLVPAVSYSVEAKKTFLEGLCAHLTTKDKNGTILHKVTLDMDETQYIIFIHK